MKHYAVYYFVNIIDGVLEDIFPYLVNFDGLFGQNEIQYYLSPFRKETNFHAFISFIIDSVFFEDRDSLIEIQKGSRLDIETFYIQYGIDHLSFESYLKSRDVLKKDISEYEISEYKDDMIFEMAYDSLMTQLTEEVFWVLFSNRKILRRFNLFMSGYLEGDRKEEYEEQNNTFLKKTGTLKRVNIPMWVKRAVYFRDRGRCVFCNKDLSGVISFQNKENYDHIIPLSQHGFNDVTNIQLLCFKCNNNKSDKNTKTSNRYEKWF